GRIPSNDHAKSARIGCAAFCQSASGIHKRKVKARNAVSTVLFVPIPASTTQKGATERGYALVPFNALLAAMNLSPVIWKSAIVKSAYVATTMPTLAVITAGVR